MAIGSAEQLRVALDLGPRLLVLAERADVEPAALDRIGGDLLAALEQPSDQLGEVEPGRPPWQVVEHRGVADVDPPARGELDRRLLVEAGDEATFGLDDPKLDVD